MSTIARIDLGSEIEHSLPLHSCFPGLRGDCPLHPKAVARFFDMDEEIRAISAEYTVSGESSLLDISLPITFWKEIGGPAGILSLDSMSAKTLRHLTQVMASTTEMNNLRQIPMILDVAASEFATSQSRRSRILAIYTRHVTMVMDANLDFTLGDIDGETYGSEEEKTQILEPALGKTFINPPESHHGRIAEMRNVKSDLGFLDQILLQQTGVRLKTRAGPIISSIIP